MIFPDPGVLSVLRKPVKRLLLLLICLLASCGARDPLPEFPRLMLWAWERPEHLGYINPAAAGVAYLARTVSWRDGQVASRPRLQPLDVPPGTALMTVIRLESAGPPLPDAAAIVEEVLKDANDPRSQALELDFDARASEREWYRDVVRRVRSGLYPSKELTITALASWCLGDPWIHGMPVADAVPMLFRMGAGQPREIGEFRVPLCRSSVGISTDELPYAVPHGRRLFVFNPRPWTEAAYRAALELQRKWR
jgi:hypothetical protein